MKYAKTVNLTYGEKKALERKYKKIMNREARKKTQGEFIPWRFSQSESSAVSKKVTVSKVPMENDNGDNGSFFKYAYRFYYLLDMPPLQAFCCFCECMRTADEGKAVAYLYDYGIQKRSELIDTARRSTVEYREHIEEKFEFIKDKLKNNMFERLTK